nr:hypothetical protein [Tanacetum cinerariifolium]
MPVFDDEPEAPEEALQFPGHASPCPNYVPGPNHLPSLDYAPGPEYLEYLGYIADFDPEEDPNENPTEYPTDEGDYDNDDEKEEEHIAPADSITLPMK